MRRAVLAAESRFQSLRARLRALHHRDRPRAVPCPCPTGDVHVMGAQSPHPPEPKKCLTAEAGKKLCSRAAQARRNTARSAAAPATCEVHAGLAPPQRRTFGSLYKGGADRPGRRTGFQRTDVADETLRHSSQARADLRSWSVASRRPGGCVRFLGDLHDGARLVEDVYVRGFSQ
jgi:hypothetical protein